MDIAPTPGIVLVTDPDGSSAADALARVLAAFRSGENVRAARGDHWAAAAIASPHREPTAGSEVYTDRRDILVWAGEVFLPDTRATTPDAPVRSRSVAAAILDALHHDGVAALAKIDGAFCGAWFDHRRREWVIFNDRLGLVPVFYRADGRRLIAAPRMWAAWLASNAPLQLADEGVCDLLRCENMVDEHTLIRDVRWLRNGHVLRWRPDRQQVGPYWDFRYDVSPGCDASEAIATYSDLLEQALRRHATCRAPLLLGISGGLDSRMFLGMCHAIGRTPRCFTVGWPFADDVRFGRRLARAVGAEHELEQLEAAAVPDLLTHAIIATDGLHSARHLAPGMLVNHYLQRHHGAVLLEGYLQGVLGGAYVPADDDLPLDRPAHQTNWARYRLHAAGGPEIIGNLLRRDLAAASLDRWRASVDDAYRHAPAPDPLSRAEYAVARSRSGRIDCLGANLLRDAALVRHPACDRSLLDWHATVPARLRRGKQLFVELMRQRFPQLARVPRTGSSGFPLVQHRLWREWCWQRERAHRWWTALRHPWTHRWGTGGSAIGAWTFDVWRRSGELEHLIAPDARVLTWVERAPLVDAWGRASANPLEAGPLLSLAAAELMIRWLERLRADLDAGPRPAVPIEAIATSTHRCRELSLAGI